ncbi:MAG: 16S rRNA (guanine(966)-N(2))-methyltransferase RsmD [Anaerolineae bacterium]|nr:16S rRNA (guanine(966)-N(2))-methyltransferase RsmD [Anaerolineae bacterium]
MRVIAGSAKGIPLRPVPGTGTRPITDRVKESLFNILGDWIVDARVLDLFAGTGGVGIEALSRGAAHATFVEKNPRAVATIKDNLKNTRLQDRAHVAQADVFAFLRGQPDPFDLVYIAPPQYQGLWHKTLETLEQNPGWLYPQGLVVVQIFPKEFEPVPLRSLHLADERKYGSTLLCFYDAVPEP